MIESLPNYISIAFILTTFLTVGFIFYAIRQTVSETFPAKILIFFNFLPALFPGSAFVERILSEN